MKMNAGQESKGLFVNVPIPSLNKLVPKNYYQERKKSCWAPRISLSRNCKNEGRCSKYEILLGDLHQGIFIITKITVLGSQRLMQLLHVLPHSIGDLLLTNL